MAASLAQAPSMLASRASATDLSGSHRYYSSSSSASHCYQSFSSICGSQVFGERVGRCARVGCDSRALQALLAVRDVNKWEGRSHLGSLALSHAVSGCTGMGKWGQGKGVVQASLLGVGAPEVLVIAVVALLVFGPKGLAEVARNLGNTLRGFQPVIKELQQVSAEFRGTLEKEIGLDELRNPSPYITPASPPPQPRPPITSNPAEPAPYSAEDYARITEEQTKAFVTEEMKRASEAAAWGNAAPPKPAATTEASPATSPVINPVTSPVTEPKDTEEKTQSVTKENVNRN